MRRALTSFIAIGHWPLAAGRPVRAGILTLLAKPTLLAPTASMATPLRRPARAAMPSQQPTASGQGRVPGMIVIAFVTLQSCQITDHSERDPNAITAEALNIPASGYQEGDTTDLPRMAFDSTAKNFGKVAQGTLVDKSWTFENVGGSDLVITDVRGTCGCTVGKDWPKAPVHPGEGGTITVTFDSEGRSGLQDKTITVTGNTQPPTTVLLLKGEVVAPPTN